MTVDYKLDLKTKVTHLSWIKSKEIILIVEVLFEALPPGCIHKITHLFHELYLHDNFGRVVFDTTPPASPLSLCFRSATSTLQSHPQPRWNLFYQLFHSMSWLAFWNPIWWIMLKRNWTLCLLSKRSVIYVEYHKVF